LYSVSTASSLKMNAFIPSISMQIFEAAKSITIRSILLIIIANDAVSVGIMFTMWYNSTYYCMLQVCSFQVKSSNVLWSFCLIVKYSPLKWIVSHPIMLRSKATLYSNSNSLFKSETKCNCFQELPKVLARTGTIFKMMKSIGIS